MLALDVYLRSPRRLAQGLRMLAQDENGVPFEPRSRTKSIYDGPDLRNFSLAHVRHTSPSGTNGAPAMAK